MVLNNEDVLWRPGRGPDLAALARMCSAFPRPEEPMGEAWFMGETRHMFTNLMNDIDVLSVKDVEKPLEEIASGTASFGQSAEWRDWFLYLLPRLVPRANEQYVSSLNELLVTALMSQYPSGTIAPAYPTFQEDVLITLGRTIMDQSCWQDGRVVLGRLLHRHNRWQNGRWGWDRTSGDFSAGMFFYLKYLPTDYIQAWIESVLEIDCPYWRAQVVVWFVGAFDVLMGEFHQPSDFPDSSDVQWNWSFCLRGADTSSGLTRYFPEENCLTVLQSLAAKIDPENFQQWIAGFAIESDLKAELKDLPDCFRELYL
ncbi:hypothetical protein [Oryzifoliimicrobium ureilyticus]|uniref:hypothetical protein n=1 Tax=Oryzifoliimicrobium ureilyticus TaxID=3113724 RepID=UPI003076208C